MKKFLKDYFDFSSFERNAILFLSVCIVGLAIFNLLIPSIKNQQKFDFRPFEDAYTRLNTRVEGAENDLDKDRVETYFEIDPNNAGKQELERFGFKSWMASNIIKYREAGGSFKKSTDLLKIYGMDSVWFKKIEPYININIAEKNKEPENNKFSDSARHGEAADSFSAADRKNIFIKLNSSNKEEWMKLRGIGPIYAKRIIQYRQRLGGYVSKEQLLEVYGMDSILFYSIEEHILPDSIVPRKIALNTASFKELVRHPYISYEQTKLIIKTKSKVGTYKSPYDLYDLGIISNKDSMNMLLPYLNLW